MCWLPNQSSGIFDPCRPIRDKGSGNTAFVYPLLVITEGCIAGIRPSPAVRLVRFHSTGECSVVPVIMAVTPPFGAAPVISQEQDQGIVCFPRLFQLLQDLSDRSAEHTSELQSLML